MKFVGSSQPQPQRLPWRRVINETQLNDALSGRWGSLPLTENGLGGGRERETAAAWRMGNLYIQGVRPFCYLENYF